MFRPNQVAKLRRIVGRDLHAREILADPVDIQIAVIRLDIGMQRTSVRADSSASRGAGEERVVDGKILVSLNTALAHEDRVEIRGQLFRIIGTHKRFTVFGQLDHIEVDLQVVP